MPNDAAPRPDAPLTLLGGLTPRRFLKRHWQRKPLLVRAALPRFEPLLGRAQLFALARRAGVESRLVVRDARGRWTLEHGPFEKAALPPPSQPRWTLLVQGVDLHHDAAHALLQSFRFVPDARLDDLMISWASDGGGVGPHVDSYDVFLLQAAGTRRWRIGRERAPSFVRGSPLKILRRFSPTEEHVLGPGDMLYLPPQWAHEGVAEGGECMTYSIGFRAPRRRELAAALLERLASDSTDETIYEDARLEAAKRPAEIPARLQRFAAAAVHELLGRDGIDAALGEIMSEPKPGVTFDEPGKRWTKGAVVLDRRTRMLYDEHNVYINGDSYRATGADARVLRRLADTRRLDAKTVRAASSAARALLREWCASGWLWPEGDREPRE
ncbi:MAG TPA: cupin domain-containing protein [Gammaproteobacteria bacterium]|nr:cupin domain-containing protein [Gammaproteobacteria bacterium]